MNVIIIGNVISFIGAMIMVSIGLIKKRERILLAQCFQFAFMGVGNLVLGGVTAFVTNALSILRNMICFKWKYTMPLKIAFISIQVAISYKVNTMGLIGWFPIIATSVFTWFLDVKSDAALKTVIILTQILWLIYDFTLFNYASLAFDVLTIASNSVGIVMLYKKKSNNDPNI